MSALPLRPTPSVPTPQARAFDPSVFADLRRKRTIAETDRILHLSQWLLPSDRALITAMFADHRTAIEAGALVSRTPRQVRKQLRALLRRLADPAFELVVRARDQWPTVRRRIATAVFLHGKTQRQTATHLQLSFHSVRTETQLIRALADEHTARKTHDPAPPTLRLQR